MTDLVKLLMEVYGMPVIAAEELAGQVMSEKQLRDQQTTRDTKAKTLEGLTPQEIMGRVADERRDLDYEKAYFRNYLLKKFEADTMRRIGDRKSAEAGLPAGSIIPPREDWPAAPAQDPNMRLLPNSTPTTPGIGGRLQLMARPKRVI